MAEWIYFIHPKRDNFAAMMTNEERAVWSGHFARGELRPFRVSMLRGRDPGDPRAGLDRQP